MQEEDTRSFLFLLQIQKPEDHTNWMMCS